MLTVSCPCCRRPVAIDIFSIGVFKFKGVAGTYNVVQVMPTQLAGRNEHFPATLPRGKATCLSRDVEKLSHVTVQLPDYDLPQVSCMARPAAACVCCLMLWS